MDTHGLSTTDTQALARALRTLLVDLNSASKDIEASAVVTRDGLTLTSALAQGVDTDRLGAMCATLLGLAETTSNELARGELEQVMIKGSRGCVLTMQIDRHAVLAVVGRPTMNLGMVFVEAKRCARLAAEYFR